MEAGVGAAGLTFTVSDTGFVPMAQEPRSFWGQELQE